MMEALDSSEALDALEVSKAVEMEVSRRGSE